MELAIDYDATHSRVDLVFDTTRVVRVPMAINENVQYFTITSDGTLEETEFWPMIEEGLDPMTGTRLIDYDVVFTLGIADDGWDMVDRGGHMLAGGAWEEQTTYALSI